MTRAALARVHLQRFKNFAAQSVTPDVDEPAVSNDIFAPPVSEGAPTTVQTGEPIGVLVSGGICLPLAAYCTVIANLFF